MGSVTSHASAGRLRVSFAASLVILYLAIMGILLGGLLLLPVAMVFGWVEGNWFVALLFLAIASLMLNDIWPRGAVGLEGSILLNRSEQPRLFDVIDRTARQSGQRPFDLACLTMGPEAGVWRPDTRFGLGGRRVLILGAPILLSLTTSELRAVLGHEYGHFVGGGHRLRYWLHEVRRALVNDVRGIPGQFLLTRPIFWLFRWVFLRLSAAVARDQEYEADLKAAAIAGPQVMIRALRRLHAIEWAMGSYVQCHVHQVTSAGRRPRVLDGFRRFLRSEDEEGTLRRVEAAIENDTRTQPLDEHPSLGERVDALAAVTDPAIDIDPAADEADGVDPVWLLLDDRERLTLQLEWSVFHSAIRYATTIEWEDVGDEIIVPLGRRLLHRHTSVFYGHTLGDVQDWLDDDLSLIRRFSTAELSGADLHSKLAYVVEVLASALCVALHMKGWKIGAMPGEPVRAHRDGVDVELAAFVHDAVHRRLAASEWRSRLESWEIADFDVAHSVRTTTTAVPEPDEGSGIVDPAVESGGFNFLQYFFFLMLLSLLLRTCARDI